MDSLVKKRYAEQSLKQDVSIKSRNSPVLTVSIISIAVLLIMSFMITGCEAPVEEVSGQDDAPIAQEEEIAVPRGDFIEEPVVEPVDEVPVVEPPSEEKKPEVQKFLSIEIFRKRFEPFESEAEPGTVLVLTNRDTIVHPVYIRFEDELILKSTIIKPGGSLSVVLDRKGVYKAFEPTYGFKGIVEVQKSVVIVDE